ncbi:hypothetical protein NMY3_03394 [Candidatus Nitrosocosmicus oleophilus]|uniref:Uncharacterized protein n=1 Tax=Candidatus Nitrosocosmicus oleophilus TaxID=1353260 RepID=A0A654M2Y7_9ARCH|nr:hypothetical protein NMY3_03394 [Candidatus Nitrosocosmicus oleophilus]
MFEKGRKVELDDRKIEFRKILFGFLLLQNVKFLKDEVTTINSIEGSNRKN